MVTAIAETIRACTADEGQSLDSLLTLSHFILSDMEGFLPGFAGDVTLDSINPGAGGLEGIDFLEKEHINEEFGKLMKEWSERKQNEIKSWLSRKPTEKQMLFRFYKVMEAYLLRDEHQKLRESLLFFKTEDGDLINLLTWQPFSLADAEHFLCKLNVTVISSTATRTISESKGHWEKHCHPVPGNPPFVKWLEKPFLFVRSAFYHLFQTGWIQQHASQKLEYYHSYYTDDNGAHEQAQLEDLLEANERAQLDDLLELNHPEKNADSVAEEHNTSGSNAPAGNRQLDQTIPLPPSRVAV